MPKDAAATLRSIVLHRLAADAALSALGVTVSRDAGAHDAYDESTPFIQIVRYAARIWASATFDGAEHELELRIAAAGGEFADKAASRVIALLDDADFDLPGHALIEMKLRGIETRYGEEEGLLSFTQLRFSALTVTD